MTGTWLQHFVITRFSVRAPDRGTNQGHWSSTWYRRIDPLTPARLAVRQTLFEITCLPSVLNQSTHDFDWILIVDPELPAASVNRLDDLLSDRPRVFLHRYSGQEDLTGLAWLRPYIRGTPRYVVTTNVDDDDAMCRGYLEAIQEHLRELGRRAALPAYKVFGTTHAIEWDLVSSPAFRFGFRSPWHRTVKDRPSVASCGYSLAVRYPTFDRSALGLPVHSIAERIFDPDCSRSECLEARRAFAVVAAAAGIDERSDVGRYYDVGAATPAIVITNHPFNDQARRVYEPKRGRVPVAGPEQFPDVPIDWDRLREYVESFAGA